MAVQAEHERLQHGVAKAEGQGENISYTRVHSGAVPSVGTQGSSDPGLAQNQRQKVSVGDDLEEMAGGEELPEWLAAFPFLCTESCFSKGFSGTLLITAIVSS